MGSKYRDNLPQLSGKRFLTDSGMETTLVFKDGIDLPHFAAFILLDHERGRQWISEYFDRHIKIAVDRGLGFLLEAPTWRANADWAGKLGYDAAQTAEANRRAIELLAGIRERFESSETPMVISGCIGPRGDGYDPSNRMSVAEAAAYHSPQVQTFAETEADQVSAFTLNYVDEAIGVSKAAQEISMPVVISFTVETDGRLPTGEHIGDAIGAVDDATDDGPAYYMLNCAHPTHFADALAEDAPWLKRLRGVRANASRLSHAELDEADVLDDGDPFELGQHYAELMKRLPHLTVFGGCCGTDHRHITQIGLACHNHATRDQSRAA